MTFSDYIIQEKGEVFYIETLKDLPKYQSCTTLEKHLTTLHDEYLKYIERKDYLKDTTMHTKWFETPDEMATFIAINDYEIDVQTAVVKDGNFNRGYFLIFRGPMKKSYG